MNVAGLGARATVIGFTGDDEDGSILAAMLKTGGVDAHLIPVRDTPTTSKLRILGGSQQMVRLDIETTARAPGQRLCRLLEKVNSLLPNIDGIILSDYAKGTLTAENCQSHNCGGPAGRASHPGRSKRSRLPALSRRHHHLPQPEGTRPGDRRIQRKSGYNPRPRTVPRQPNSVSIV